MSIEVMELENFLSFEHVRVELGKLNILVGPNASGKSNFVKALMFLSRLVKGDISLASDYLGLTFKEIVHNFDLSKEVKFHVELNVGEDHLTYEVAMRNKAILREALVQEDGTILMKRAKKKWSYVTAAMERAVPSPRELLRGLSPIQTALAYCVSKGNAHPLLLKTKQVIEGICAYSFEAGRIRSRASTGHSLRLERDGSNLAQVLFSLLTSDRKRFFAIEEELKSLIPEVEELDVPTTEDGGETYIALRERGISEPLRYPNISDGTLRLLAFITAIHLGGSLVAFEEPENCVHPYLFQALIEICRRGPSQVVITTHSPYLVDKAAPEELLLVVKREGRSMIRRLTEKEKATVKKMLEEGFTLGELWYMCEFGDEP